MSAKCNSKDREGVAYSGGNNNKSQYLLEVAFRYVRAYFFARLTPQLVPVKIKEIDNIYVVTKK